MSNMNDHPDNQYKGKTVPLAFHQVSIQKEKREKRNILVCWTISIVILASIFAYMWLQYDYVGKEEYTGIYNIVDSEGNVISSDISPKDLLNILEVLNNGNIQEDTTP